MQRITSDTSNRSSDHHEIIYSQLKRGQIGLVLSLTCLDHQTKCLCEAEETTVSFKCHFGHKLPRTELKVPQLKRAKCSHPDYSKAEVP